MEKHFVGKRRICFRNLTLRNRTKVVETTGTLTGPWIHFIAICPLS